MHTMFLDTVRGHFGLAQPPVPSRAYRNRSPKVTKGRSHQLRSYRCEPTAQCKQLHDTGRQSSTAERNFFFSFFFASTGDSIDANSGILGFLALNIVT